MKEKYWEEGTLELNSRTQSKASKGTFNYDVIIKWLLPPCSHFFDFGNPLPSHQHLKLYIKPHPSLKKTANRMIV